MNQAPRLSRDGPVTAAAARRTPQPGNAAAMDDHSARAAQLRELVQLVRQGYGPVAQRQRVEAFFRPALQRKDASAEDELQMKVAPPAQRAGVEEEEALQGRFAPVQRAAPEEDELQMKAVPAQRASVEDEEPLQGKFGSPIQRAGPEEDELQLKSIPGGTAQRAGGRPQTNATGLPDQLKAGVESLSGLSLDDVQVHYNSTGPAALNAHAYAQGSDIHLAPGAEEHLPHEAWHVVQQKQGRVRATMQMKGGVPVNDDPTLEREADGMGAKALTLGAQLTSGPNKAVRPQGKPASAKRVVQRSGPPYVFRREPAICLHQRSPTQDPFGHSSTVVQRAFIIGNPLDGSYYNSFNVANALNTIRNLPEIHRNYDDLLNGDFLQKRLEQIDVSPQQNHRSWKQLVKLVMAEGKLTEGQKEDIDQEAFERAVAATEHLRLEMDVDWQYSGNIAEAATRFEKVEGQPGYKIVIDVNEDDSIDEYSQFNYERRLGQRATLFIHELAYHGNRDAYSRLISEADNPDVDHRSIFLEPTRDKYLTAFLHSLLERKLTARERAGLLDSWYLDVKYHIEVFKQDAQEEEDALEWLEDARADLGQPFQHGDGAAQLTTGLVGEKPFQRESSPVQRQSHDDEKILREKVPRADRDQAASQLSAGVPTQPMAFVRSFLGPQEAKQSADAQPRAIGADAAHTATQSVLQRHIMFDTEALGADVYETGYEDGTLESVDEFVTKVLEHQKSLKGVEDEIKTIITIYAGDGPDFAYSSIADAIGWLYKNGLKAQTIDSSDDEVVSEGEDRSEEQQGQVVGKLFFPGDTYHVSVKRAVIKGIGVKRLSLLVYKDSKHTNFNFWFEKDGHIYAEQNSDRNSKGVDTRYRWDGKTVVEV